MLVLNQHKWREPPCKWGRTCKPAINLQSRREAPPGSGAGAGEQLKEQFHAALSKLDDLACVKRQRVMPAEL
jgi:hypothetical protein